MTVYTVAYHPSFSLDVNNWSDNLSWQASLFSHCATFSSSPRRMLLYRKLEPVEIRIATLVTASFRICLAASIDEATKEVIFLAAHKNRVVAGERGSELA